MRKTLGVAALMLALCCPALAGEIPTPPAPQPGSALAGEIPNPPAPSDGTTHTGEFAQTAVDGITHGDSTDALTQIMLNLLASVLP